MTDIPAYIPRAIEPALAMAAQTFPAVVLTGPRQSGKTTVLAHMGQGSLRKVFLEAPDVRAAAMADPRGFLDLHPPPLLLDEVQAVPELLPYLKERIDAERHRAGQWFLTGSESLLLSERIGESLAGRAAILRLMPLGLDELLGQPGRPLPWERPVQDAPPLPLPEGEALWDLLIRGGWPELAAWPARPHALWMASMVQTWLERDVWRVRNVGDLGTFSTFLSALAARSAGLLHQTELGRDIGAASNTVKAWLSVLEATHMALLLRPWFANVGKRLVKTPKVYFADVGLMAWLTGHRDGRSAALGPLRGQLVETLVVGEVQRRLLHRGEVPALWFWRTATGDEVDLLVQVGTNLVPVEIKATASPRPELAAPIKRLRAQLGPRVLPGFVVHLGRELLPLGDGDLALPLRML